MKHSSKFGTKMKPPSMQRRERERERERERKDKCTN